MNESMNQSINQSKSEYKRKDIDRSVICQKITFKSPQLRAY